MNICSWGFPTMFIGGGNICSWVNEHMLFRLCIDWSQKGEKNVVLEGECVNYSDVLNVFQEECVSLCSIIMKSSIVMKQIEVVAAIIHDDEGRIFATQRGYGEWKDWWEFPGGKMEAGETPVEALMREIREELSAEISVDELLCTVEYDYPQFHLTLHCFLCSLVTEALHLNEHEAAKWLTKDELDSVKWLPADWEVVEALKTTTL